MDYLLLAVGVFVVTTFFYWYKSTDLLRQAAYMRTLYNAESSDLQLRYLDLVARIIKRLNLRSKKLPPLNYATWIKVDEIWDDLETSGPCPAECIDEHNYAWVMTIDDLDDVPLFLLWINGVIE